ncbi:zinc finger BED domain-containing protein RICESLEEPER 2-like [Hevea brasiliensis]|uniref:zinc finger BED domain-containing protein RICESLEEPER 2-like n=1 Tax=Hevea brasiliensis TaxID=3981 RepID=UPI0025DEEAAA|nr:zinc finger BED domain-containing protein RICESLEEPER 2-like [Hevea brasiliensis]
MAQQETTNDLLVEPSHPPPVASSQTEVDEATSKMKRKGMKPRSAVWDHFSKFVDGSGIQKGNHKGDDIGMTVESCLLNWGIKRVFIVTVDNTSSNDVAIAYLKKKIVGWGFSILNCKCLHMRCIAHIINLVVVDGLKETNVSVKRVREAVRYIRQSPARWNSTYLMLNVAQKFENAFDRYATIDPCFKFDLQSSDGLPDSLDWENVRRLVDFLGHFYDLTLRISGSRYVTSNIFFNEISSVDCLLQEWQGSNDIELACMGDRMKVKFDKYWGDPDKMNKIIYIAVVVDPRYKLEFMEFALSVMYEKEKGMELVKKIKLTVYELFDEYKKTYQAEHERGSNVAGNTSENNESEGAKKKSRLNLGDQFLKHKIETGEANSKSDLDCYLNEGIKVVDEKEEFDILKWWQLNSGRFPILSITVRDILAMPISTVASESAFGTRGRKSHCCKSIEEQIADLERLEEAFSLCEISSINDKTVNLDS